MKRRLLALIILASSILVLAASCPFLNSDDIPAVNQSPTVQFTATPSLGLSPLLVSFNALGSSDPDGSIQSFAWSFGDGTSGSGAQVTHTYSATIARTFLATLTVTDNQGLSASTTSIITVSVTTSTPQPSAPCNCAGPDKNCSDFSAQAQAQACYDYCKSQGYGDVFRLDADSDGSACESLP
jgi:PKD repeat protein